MMFDATVTNCPEYVNFVWIASMRIDLVTNVSLAVFTREDYHVALDRRRSIRPTRTNADPTRAIDSEGRFSFARIAVKQHDLATWQIKSPHPFRRQWLHVSKPD